MFSKPRLCLRFNATFVKMKMAKDFLDLSKIETNTAKKGLKAKEEIYSRLEPEDTEVRRPLLRPCWRIGLHNGDGMPHQLTEEKDIYFT